MQFTIVTDTSCDLLENSYLCGSNNNVSDEMEDMLLVVICLKIPTFVVATTTSHIQLGIIACCDLLENSYLCGSNNNGQGLLGISVEL